MSVKKVYRGKHVTFRVADYSNASVGEPSTYVEVYKTPENKFTSRIVKWIAYLRFKPGQFKDIKDVIETFLDNDIQPHNVKKIFNHLEKFN